MACRQYILAGQSLTDMFMLSTLYTSDSNVELVGHLDMPARIGKTYHEWPDENSVEPYVREDEIFFGGRDITIRAFISFDNIQQFYQRVREMNLLFDSFDGEQLLETDFGDYDVTVKNVTVERLFDTEGIIHLNFRQAIVPIVGDWPSGNPDGGYGIDGYSWEQLGVSIACPSGDYDRAESKYHEVSVYGFEKNRVKWHKANNVQLNFFIRDPTYSGLEGKINRMAWILAQPGKRMLRLKDGSIREVFSIQGFSVSKLRTYSTESYANLVVNLTEIRKLDNIVIMGDDDVQVLGTARGEKIAYTF